MHAPEVILLLLGAAVEKLHEGSAALLPSRRAMLLGLLQSACASAEPANALLVTAK